MMGQDGQPVMGDDEQPVMEVVYQQISCEHVTWNRWGHAPAERRQLAAVVEHSP
jgi:hypothetical protein